MPNLTPPPYPLDNNGYSMDQNTSSHIQASVEKALDNRTVPELMRSMISELQTLNSKMDTANATLSTIASRISTTNTTLGNTNSLLTDIKANTTPAS